MQLRQHAAGFVRTEGGLLPPDLLERVRALDRKLPGLDEAAYGLRRGERFGEAITRSWNNLVGDWATLQRELATVGPDDPATTPTRERWLLPLFEELGYGRLASSRAVEVEGKTYPVSHAFELIPLHLVGANVPLDRRSRGVAGAAGQSPHGLVQELLNRSPERLWGIVTNGRVLRLLRDNASLTRQAYLEFDLQGIFDGEAYADFALLWHVAHRTRLEPRVPEGAEEGSGPRPDGSYIERWTKVAADEGTRARDRLRDGVQEGIEALGQGFLAHPANSALRAALKSGELSKQDYYRELLRLVYRLILLFVAEDRDLLLDPRASAEARGRYVRYYSTARLRRLAERRRGTRHADLYSALRVVIAAVGRDEGAPGIALPALSGFLFGSEACPHLDAGELANADLLAAVRKLATIEERAVLRAVDYRDLGSEELGSIYESLLELHPELDADAATFALHTAPGHERKTTGSYYTPTSLISVLLDSALDPVLAEAADKPTVAEAERAILDLKVVDPAAGSGHFLVAAAHRIAKRLASVRTGDEEPAPEAIRTALRDVIGHCLYAVDLNPMAVELCKVSVWLEALEPGRPLSFLDAHIKVGNSLLGVTPALLAQGIPDAAYREAHALDEGATCRALARRNRDERAPRARGITQLTLDEHAARAAQALREAANRLAQAPDDTPAALAAKERLYQEQLGSDAYRRAKLAGDAWCAAFFLSKRNGAEGITTDTVRRLAENPDSVPPALRAEVERCADELGFFHWHLEFPEIFRVGEGEPEEPAAGWSGGFHVVLGNPPWEQVQLSEQEFFAARSPNIAATAGAARKRRIAQLMQDDSALYLAYLQALHRSEAERDFLGTSGRFALTGRGKINTYAVFAETFRMLLAGSGRAGIIVPTGIATDATTQVFFGTLVERRQLASLYDFENRRALFPGVHRSYKFCLLTLAGRRRPAAAAEFAFFCQDVADLDDPERRFALTPADFRLLNPNTRTAPIFRTRRDAELTRHIYRRVPVLVEEAAGASGNPWGVEFRQGLFNMTTHSHLFRTCQQLEAQGFRLEGNVFVRGDERYLPLYEAKMVHQFDHRFGDYADQPAGSESTQLPDVALDRLLDPDYQVLPRYWVAERDVEERLAGRWDRAWLLGWRDITNVTNERTVIAAVIPRVAVGNNYPLALTLSVAAPYLAAVLSALPLDFVARQKAGGTHLNFFIFEQLPVLPPAAFDRPCPWSPRESLADWLRPRVLELTYTAWDLQPFARDLGYDGPPFRYDPERRALLRAELDACFFHLYLGSPAEWAQEATPELRRLFPTAREAVTYICEQFPIVKRRDEARHGEYRTKRVTLEVYDAMAEAIASGRSYQTILELPPGDPSAAHLSRPGEPRGRWIEPDERPSAVAQPVPTRLRQTAVRAPTPSTHPAPQPHAEPHPRAAEGQNALSEARSSTNASVQVSLPELARSALAGDAWIPESAVDPAELQPGRAVRHRSWGEGTIVWVRTAGRSTSLVVRFPSGDHEVLFGLGTLEFAG